MKGFKKLNGITLAELERLVATNKHMVTEIANFTYKFADKAVFLTVQDLWNLVFGDKKDQESLVAIWVTEKVAYDALQAPTSATSVEELLKAALAALNVSRGVETAVSDAAKEQEKIDILLSKTRFEVLDEVYKYMLQRNSENTAEAEKAKEKAKTDANLQAQLDLIDELDKEAEIDALKALSPEERAKKRAEILAKMGK
jgi:hypothetical protein